MFLDVRDLTITLKTGEEIAKDMEEKCCPLWAALGQ